MKKYAKQKGLFQAQFYIHFNLNGYFWIDIFYRNSDKIFKHLMNIFFIVSPLCSMVNFIFFHKVTENILNNIELMYRPHCALVRKVSLNDFFQSPKVHFQDMIDWNLMTQTNRWVVSSCY